MKKAGQAGLVRKIGFVLLFNLFFRSASKIFEAWLFVAGLSFILIVFGHVQRTSFSRESAPFLFAIHHVDNIFVVVIHGDDALFATDQIFFKISDRNGFISDFAQGNDRV